MFSAGLRPDRYSAAAVRRIHRRVTTNPAQRAGRVRGEAANPAREARGRERLYGVFAAGAAGAGVSTFALMFTLWLRPPTMPRPKTNHATMASRTMTTIAHAAPEPPPVSTTVGGCVPPD